jgi:hypothetical protein
MIELSSIILLLQNFIAFFSFRICRVRALEMGTLSQAACLINPRSYLARNVDLEISSILHPHFVQLTFETLHASNGLTFPHGYCKCSCQILYHPCFINASIPYLYKKSNALGFFCSFFLLHLLVVIFPLLFSHLPSSGPMKPCASFLFRGVSSLWGPLKVAHFYIWKHNILECRYEVKRSL